LANDLKLSLRPFPILLSIMRMPHKKPFCQGWRGIREP
jgi:hypothetical protein